MIPTYVFVHGSGTNSHSWNTIRTEMTLRGHRTVAVDLPGRGAGFSLAYLTQDLAAFAKEPSSAAGVTGTRTVEQIVEVVRRARDNGPVTLVAHSFGGLPITGVGNAVPELVDRLVYIAAQCPVDSNPWDYVEGPKWSESEFLPLSASLYVGNPLDQGFIRVNWRGAGPEMLAMLRKSLFADATDEEFHQRIATLQPDEILWQNEPTWDIRAEKDTWGRIPHTYIRAVHDKAMPLAAQDRYIKEADTLTPANPFEVHSINSGHVDFMKRPDEVVDLLTRLA